MKHRWWILFALLSLAWGMKVTAQTPNMLKSVAGDAQCKQWVDSVMNTLSLKKQLGQLFVYTLETTPNDSNRKLLRKVVKDYGVGGLLFSEGTLHNQAVMNNEAQRLAEVPVMITFDGEWGLAMRLKDSPSFPRNMVLGCIENDELLYRYGREVAREMKELCVHVNFSPVADVNINPKNPVINTRSFGESPQLVAKKVIAYSRGLEDGGVLSVTKHFPGHGDTDVDSHKALPTLTFSRARLDSVELYPFRKAFQAGLGGVMVGHLDVWALEKKRGCPSSLSSSVVSGLLKKEMNFQGLVFTDALAMKGVSNNRSVCLQALKAGNDMLLVPRRIKEEVETILNAVKQGEISEEYIAEKCRKVLTYKYALGMYRPQKVRLSGLEQRINTPEASQLISDLRKASITLLNNQNRALPLGIGEKVAVLQVGSTGVQAFMHEMNLWGEPTRITVPANQTVTAVRQLNRELNAYQRVVVAVTEEKLDSYQTFFREFNPVHAPVYLFFTPAKSMKNLPAAVKNRGSVILAHAHEDDIQQQVAAAVYGQKTINGRLSASIGHLYPTLSGQDLAPQSQPYYRPEELGYDSRLLSAIDTIANEAIREKAAPGCQIVVLKDGKELYNKTFGSHTYDNVFQKVMPTDLYDLASLTKTTATLLAVMKLYDQGLLNLTDYVANFLPELKNSDKRNITIRDLLFHESGLQPTLLFYMEAIDENSYSGPLYTSRRDFKHTVRTGFKAWGNPKFRYKPDLISPIKTNVHTLQVAEHLWVNASFKDGYLQQIKKARLYSKRYRYSCVGFILLQKVVEACTGMSLDTFLNKEFYHPMGLHQLGYLPLLHTDPSHIVPSANDTFLHRGLICGFVHDEAAAFQGGVSGNAGLFGNATDVAQIYQMLLNGGTYKGTRYLSKSTCDLFATKTSRISRRGLGFDKPLETYSKNSPCCESAPRSVYGHTGFTGTCAWVDPENRLVYVFLSNRTYPNVWNTKLSKMDIRTRIQQAIYDARLK